MSCSKDNLPIERGKIYLMIYLLYIILLTLRESLVLWACIFYKIFCFVCCLVLVKSLKLPMRKFEVVQPNISSGISACVSAIFQKFSQLNFNCDHHKSMAWILFPFSSARTSPRLLYSLEFRSMTEENFLVIKETLKIDRIIMVIFRDVKHTKVLSLLPTEEGKFHPVFQ